MTIVALRVESLGLRLIVWSPSTPDSVSCTRWCLWDTTICCTLDAGKDVSLAGKLRHLNLRSLDGGYSRGSSDRDWERIPDSAPSLTFLGLTCPSADALSNDDSGINMRLALLRLENCVSRCVQHHAINRLSLRYQDSCARQVLEIMLRRICKPSKRMEMLK